MDTKKSMVWDKVKDSGQGKTEYNTGSKRDNRKGKGRYDLLPTRGLRRLAIHYENGAVKYGANNWKKGQPLMESYFSSALRHAFAWADCKDDEDHIAAAIWNLMAALETEEMIAEGILPEELDDRWRFEQEYEEDTTADEQYKYFTVSGLTAISSEDTLEDTFYYDTPVSTHELRVFCSEHNEPFSTCPKCQYGSAVYFTKQ